MSNAYADFQQHRVPGGPNQQTIERVFGGEKDEQLDRIRQALLVGFPGQAPATALNNIGAERMLPRVSGETDDAYAERLRTVWDGLGGWSYAGSHGSLLRALDRAGFPMGTPDGAHIIQRVRRYSWLTASGGDVTFGTHPGMVWDPSPETVWNQFAIFFGADVPDLDVDTPLADTLNRIVRLWKPAKARFMGTWVIVTGPVWDWPIGTLWDPGINWDDSESRHIPPL